MPNAVRVGDTNTAGGAILSGASTVTIEGLPAALPGHPVAPHPCCGATGCGAHCSATTSGGSSTVTIEGQPALLSTDLDTCGHGRALFAATVTIGS